MTVLLTLVLMEAYVRIKLTHLHVSVKLGLQELHAMSVSISVNWKLYVVFHSLGGGDKNLVIPIVVTRIYYDISFLFPASFANIIPNEFWKS